jgi:hypothetical protein
MAEGAFDATCTITSVDISPLLNGNHFLNSSLIALGQLRLQGQAKFGIAPPPTHAIALSPDTEC